GLRHRLLGLRRSVDSARVPALLAARAKDLRVLLSAPFDEEGVRALRTRFGDGLLPDLEVALRIVRAPVEGLAAALLRADLNDVAAALRARDTERHGLRVLAFRIAGAGQEFPVAAGPDAHRLAALVALVVRELRLFRLLAVLVQVLRVLAGRILLAAQEPPVA